MLENWICMSDVPRVRGGAVSFSTGMTGEIVAFADYRSGATSKIFAVAGDALQSVYDITAGGAVGAAALSGLVNTIWNSHSFTSSGGTFLFLCGAGNAPRTYNGTAWETPAITGFTTTTASMSWSHGNKMFFIEAGTTNAWFLATDAIAGAATKFPLVGEFSRGGTLIAGATWTTDAGDNALTASCVFISSEGEIAIYQGPNPATWTGMGTFFVGKPLGVNCFMKAGGDLVVMTEDGLFALSQIINLDRDALANNSISKNIRPLWRSVALATNTLRWQIIRHDSLGYAVVSMPSTQSRQTQFCVNLQTGAWSTFTGWKPTAVISTNDRLYFGTKEGVVFEGDAGGTDNGSPYSAVYVGPFKMGSLSGLFAKMMRAVVVAKETFAPLVSALADYKINIPTKPSAGVSEGIPKWDVDFVWDVSKWAPEAEGRGDWQVVEGNGHALAPCVIYTIGQTHAPDIKLVRTDMMIEAGDIMA
jgi:hypothetical protein